jgi:hypothetical protein
MEAPILRRFQKSGTKARFQGAPKWALAMGRRAAAPPHGRRHAVVPPHG